MKVFKLVTYVSIILMGILFSCSSDDEGDNNLEEQLNALMALSESKTCSNPEDWSFAGIGAKPCGGPSGYIAYSNEIDTNEFLDKLQKYNAAVRKHNEENGLISDCALVNPPKSIRCEDGKAVLVY